MTLYCFCYLKLSTKVTTNNKEWKKNNNLKYLPMQTPLTSSLNPLGQTQNPASRPVYTQRWLSGHGFVVVQLMLVTANKKITI